MTARDAFHADCIEPLPLKVKAPTDLEALVLSYAEDMRKLGFQQAVDARSRNPGYDSLGFDAPDFEPVRDEIERLSANDWAYGVLVAAMKKILADDPGGHFGAIAKEALHEVAA